MKKYFTFIISVLILSVGMVGCNDKKLSDEEKAKIEEQKKNEANEAVKVILVGKWQRESFTVDGFKSGQPDQINITDPGILEGLQSEMPHFFEFTMTTFEFVDLHDGSEEMINSYQIDAETNTIIILDDRREGHVGQGDDRTEGKYSIINNNSITISIIVNDDSETYDKVRMNIKLKRIPSWPAG